MNIDIPLREDVDYAELGRKIENAKRTVRQSFEALTNVGAETLAKHCRVRIDVSTLGTTRDEADAISRLAEEMTEIVRIDFEDLAIAAIEKLKQEADDAVQQIAHEVGIIPGQPKLPSAGDTPAQPAAGATQGSSNAQKGRAGSGRS